MKTRNGFVSNSSSASFVVALPITYKHKFSIALQIDLDDIYGTKFYKTVEELDKAILEHSGEDCKTIDELFKKNYAWIKQADYTKMLKALEVGCEIAIGTASNESDSE